MSSRGFVGECEVRDVVWRDVVRVTQTGNADSEDPGLRRQLLLISAVRAGPGEFALVRSFCPIRMPQRAVDRPHTAMRCDPLGLGSRRSCGDRLAIKLELQFLRSDQNMAVRQLFVCGVVTSSPPLACCTQRSPQNRHNLLLREVSTHIASFHRHEPCCSCRGRFRAKKRYASLSCLFQLPRLQGGGRVTAPSTAHR